MLTNVNLESMTSKRLSFYILLSTLPCTLIIMFYVKKSKIASLRVETLIKPTTATVLI